MLPPRQKARYNMEHFLLVIIISMNVGFCISMIIDIVHTLIDNAIRKRKRKQEQKELQDKLDGILKDLDSMKTLK